MCVYVCSCVRRRRRRGVKTCPGRSKEEEPISAPTIKEQRVTTSFNIHKSKEGTEVILDGGGGCGFEG